MRIDQRAGSQSVQCAGTMPADVHLDMVSCRREDTATPAACEPPPCELSSCGSATPAAAPACAYPQMPPAWLQASSPPHEAVLLRLRGHGSAQAPAPPPLQSEVAVQGLLRLEGRDFALAPPPPPAKQAVQGSPSPHLVASSPRPALCPRPLSPPHKVLLLRLQERG